MTTQNKLHFETLQVHVGQEHADPTTDSRAVPIYPQFPSTRPLPTCSIALSMPLTVSP